MSKGVFITGTSTDVGKTLICALILAAAHAQGLQANYFKPIQTGTDCDCTTVQTLTKLAAKHIIQPCFRLQQPQAPYRAALAENKQIAIETIVKQAQKVCTNYSVIEGAGGLLVPITATHCIRDLIKALNIPIIIVASTQLGTINHTLLTLEAAQIANISILGVVLSGAPDKGLVSTIKKFTRVPILAEVPLLDVPALENFHLLASTFFSLSRLQQIFT